MTGAMLGAIIAGGRSARYGSPKALATVAGERIIDRVQAALRAVVDDVVLIANAPELARAVMLPVRADAVPDAGALGGIFTALSWAEERGRAGMLAVACDMPFVAPSLLAALLREADVEEQGRLPDVVIPESEGPRAVEPLCAFYATACLPAVRSALARGDLRMIGFHEDVRVRRIPFAVVQQHGAPERLFLNVNTREEREAAERLAIAVAQ